MPVDNPGATVVEMCRYFHKIHEDVIAAVDAYIKNPDSPAAFSVRMTCEGRNSIPIVHARKVRAHHKELAEGWRQRILLEELQEQS